MFSDDLPHQAVPSTDSGPLPVSWTSDPNVINISLPVHLCVRCATALAAGDQDHNCIEVDPNRHPAAALRDWRCECPCQP
ncbi:hypothetical protein Pen02_64190 [Plantactinospora endophytica]|uniref:Uncharacterized protein n=1 Tax=Plantactinospora endophytica TaxID=673535 RepID=A0ABQ4E9W2_9ACTN|nr:hypothetical protein Pen02_64190 [Plantactinospora endophytica]